MCTLLAFLINPSNAAAETFATFPSYPGCLRGEPTEKELGANNGDMPAALGHWDMPRSTLLGTILSTWCLLWASSISHGQALLWLAFSW